MAKKAINKKTEKYITYGIYALAGGIVIYLIWKFLLKDKAVTPETTPFDPGTPTVSAIPSAPVYTNATVFSTKNVKTKVDRVQWIQNAYNKYAINRKLFGKTPDWPTITDDGKFGSNTEKAMIRLMNKKAVSWNEVKARTDYLQGQLNPTGFDYGN